MIRKSFLLILLPVCLSFLFCSCGKVVGKADASEVDLKNKLSVQIEYRQFIYKCHLSMNDNILRMDFYGNGDFPDGLSYVCDGRVCTLSYSDLQKSYNRTDLPQDFLPFVLHEFFSLFTEKLVTETYNEAKNCNSIKRTAGTSFVTFEVYNEGENPVYNIVIT